LFYVPEREGHTVIRNYFTGKPVLKAYLFGL